MNNTLSHRQSQPRGCTYRVVSDRLELPKGTAIVALPFPVKSGDLALFSIGDYLTIGRWISNPTGCDWIVLPEVMVLIVGETPVRIIGKVMVVESHTKQLAMPDAEEYFGNPFPRHLGD